MTYDDELYKKYKYYNAIEKSNIIQLLRTSFDEKSFSVKQRIRYFNRINFEGFYLINFRSSFLKELIDTLIFFRKDHMQLKDNLFILYYHLQFGFPNYRGGRDSYKEIIDVYCSTYDNLEKIKFRQRLQELILYQDMYCEKPITVIKLSETEYKICEKFLLKHLNPHIDNITKIEHYPKKGFIIEEYTGREIWL